MISFDLAGEACVLRILGRARAEGQGGEAIHGSQHRGERGDSGFARVVRLRGVHAPEALQKGLLFDFGSDSLQGRARSLPRSAPHPRTAASLPREHGQEGQEALNAFVTCLNVVRGGVWSVRETVLSSRFEG